MSGAELAAAISLAASITQLVDSIKKVIDRVRRIKKGTAFEDIVPQLELCYLDIQKAAQGLS